MTGPLRFIWIYCFWFLTLLKTRCHSPSAQNLPWCAVHFLRRCSNSFPSMFFRDDRLYVSMNSGCSDLLPLTLTLLLRRRSNSSGTRPPSGLGGTLHIHLEAKNHLPLQTQNVPFPHVLCVTQVLDTIMWTRKMGNNWKMSHLERLTLGLRIGIQTGELHNSTVCATQEVNAVCHQCE